MKGHNSHHNLGVDTMNQLGSIENGEHNMIIYRNVKAFEEVYSCYAEMHLAREMEDEIMLIVTFYQTFGVVRSTLTEKGIDVTKHEDNGSLVIADSVQGYQVSDVNGVIKLAKLLAVRASKERKNGVCVFADMGSFFLFERLSEMIRYETSVPKKLDVKVKAFSCYHKKDFDTLSSYQQNVLQELHYRTFAMEK